MSRRRPEPPTENPPTNEPPTNNPPTNNPPPTNNLPSNPASNQPGQPGTEVLAETVTNDPPGALSTEVQGGQQSQPEALATLPRTGSDVGLLASIGVLLAAVGSVARTACRRS